LPIVRPAAELSDQYTAPEQSQKANEESAQYFYRQSLREDCAVRHQQHTRRHDTAKRRSVYVIAAQHGQSDFVSARDHVTQRPAKAIGNPQALEVATA
jgi:hypothetical protein